VISRVSIDEIVTNLSKNLSKTKVLLLVRSRGGIYVIGV